LENIFSGYERLIREKIEKLELKEDSDDEILFEVSKNRGTMWKMEQISNLKLLNIIF
jgi:hypothetical protein